MKVKQDYSIGLDIGTDSVGYAVIGKDYKVLPYSCKKMWGVNLFDSGGTAVKRRTLRNGRRRLFKRTDRSRLLKELTSKTVLGKDESFFLRLSKSSYLTVDKDNETGRENKYNIFNDKSFTDKDYNYKYPTIYHLRYELVNSKDKADPRLIYLAMHHITKYRGNFLHEGELKTGGSDIHGLLNEYFKQFDEIMSVYEVDGQESIKLFDEMCIAKMLEILKDKVMFKSEKIKQIKALYSSKQESKIIEAHAKALLGRKIALGKVYALEDIVDEDGKELSFSFSSADFEQKERELVGAICEFGQLLMRLKDIYGAIVFDEVMLGKDTISEAMIERYDTHRDHLKWLKKCLEDDKTLYYEMFYKKSTKDTQAAVEAATNEAATNEAATNEAATDSGKKKKPLHNYWAYINTAKDCPIGEFAGYVKTTLAKVADCEEKSKILLEIERETFMPKQTSVLNSYIPHQFNLHELSAILDNQKVYYSELAENCNKIKAVLTFKRPYYIGVIKSESKFSWIEQKIDEKVYPWNFKELVNYEDAQEKFIANLTNYCIFYSNQSVLPKESISYQTYTTLNELNCLKIKNNIIPHEIKVEIFEKLCKTRNVVSIKAIVYYLNKTFGTQYSAEDITGFAGKGKLISSMSTYRALNRIFGAKFKEKSIQTYDEIVKDLTIFTDGESRAAKLKSKYKIEDSVIKELTRLRVSGWGRYCSKALNGTYDGRGKSILDVMYEKELHLNAILFDESLGFRDKLKIKVDKVEKFNYKEHIEDLYCSPKVKKAIWSAIKIVDEIEHIMGCRPKYIFVETTETDEVKKETKSRCDKIKEAYAGIKKDCEYMAEELKFEKDKAIKLTDNQLDEKLYLWLLQMGRCMYSGEYMPLDAIENYEIDHIVPRCFIKDDSIENRVLVKKIENQQKSSTLALSPLIRDKMRAFWEFLLSKSLISKKKYFNLIKDKYDEEDSARFIDRQLVETNQIVKAVRELLSMKYPLESVQGIRAGLISNMRAKYMECGKEGFYKNRLLNDLHHAKDAYLAAVLGQFVSEAYPLWGQDKEAREAKRRMFELSQHAEVAKGEFKKLVNERYGVIIEALESRSLHLFERDEDGEYKWNNTYFNNVLAQMSYNDINVVKQKVFKANKNF